VVVWGEARAGVVWAATQAGVAYYHL
jgi:hypothetical protein